MQSNNKIEKVKENLAYAAVCIFWGSTYLAIRIGVSELPPMFFAGIRFLLAGTIVLTFAYIKRIEFPNTFAEIRKISMVGVLLLFACNGSMVLAEQWVQSGIASILAATVPLFMVLIEFFIWRRKIKFKAFIGLLLGFSGVIILMLTHSKIDQINVLGVLLVLFSALMWAVGSVYSHGYKASGSMITHIGIQMLSGSFFLLAASVIFGEIPKVRITYKGVATVAYLMIFGSLIGYSCYIYILKKWSTSKAGTYAYINPIVAVFLGFIVLKEPIALSTILSILIILGGVFLVQTSKTDLNIDNNKNTDKVA